MLDANLFHEPLSHLSGPISSLEREMHLFSAYCVQKCGYQVKVSSSVRKYCVLFNRVEMTFVRDILLDLCCLIKCLPSILLSSMSELF